MGETNVRVLICGGRDFVDRERLFRELDNILLPSKPAIIIHGDAAGVDRLAGEWAARQAVKVLAVPADWSTHGRAAGPLRNQRMLDECQPDLVIAFPGGRGTADMVRRAKRAGVLVREVLPEPTHPR